MSVVDGGGADEPVPDPPVPRLEELLGRMLPLAREQQLELHGTPPALAVVLLGEGDEGAADAGAALLGRRDQHPELARVIGDVVNPNAADDVAVPRGDGDLLGPDQLGDLGCRRSCRPVAPQPASATA